MNKVLVNFYGLTTALLTPHIKSGMGNFEQQYT